MGCNLPDSERLKPACTTQPSEGFGLELLEEERATYHELLDRAMALARHLKGLGVGHKALSSPLTGRFDVTAARQPGAHTNEGGPVKRVALVTGANRGIGLEICGQLGRAGYAVVLTARDPEKGEKAAESLRREGVEAHFHPLDVTAPGAAREAAAWVERELGRLDALVNNAALSLDPTDALETVDLDVMRRTLEANFIGVLACCQAFLPMMRRQEYGRIVNVSSGRGSFSKLAAGGPCYRISKTALNALTVILADEVKETNVLVNAMTPGWVRTRLGGVKAPRSTAEGAETAVWLAMLPDDGPRGRFFKDREDFPW